jgi:hypothetical protein
MTSLLLFTYGMQNWWQHSRDPVYAQSYVTVIREPNIQTTLDKLEIASSFVTITLSVSVNNTAVLSD